MRTAPRGNQAIASRLPVEPFSFESISRWNRGRRSGSYDTGSVRVLLPPAGILCRGLVFTADVRDGTTLAGRHAWCHGLPGEAMQTSAIVGVLAWVSRLVLTL